MLTCHFVKTAEHLSWAQSVGHAGGEDNEGEFKCWGGVMCSFQPRLKPGLEPKSLVV